MELEKLTPDEIMAREIGTGQPIIYQLNDDGSVKSVKDLKGETV